jgi:hypothetical protein
MMGSHGHIKKRRFAEDLADHMLDANQWLDHKEAAVITQAKNHARRLTWQMWHISTNY